MNPLKLWEEHHDLFTRNNSDISEGRLEKIKITRYCGARLINRTSPQRVRFVRLN